MHQVKIFKGMETDTTELEESINRWIRETGARIVGMTGNIAPQTASKLGGASLGTGSFAASDVILIVLYETPST